MCIDLSHLNKYVRRERYQCPTPAQAVTDIASENAKVFTKLDDTTSAPLMKKASSSPHSLHPSVDSSICKPHMASHPFLSTTTRGWMRPLLACLGVDVLLMMSSSMTVMKPNMQHMSVSFSCKFVGQSKEGMHCRSVQLAGVGNLAIASDGCINVISILG